MKIKVENREGRCYSIPESLKGVLYAASDRCDISLYGMSSSMITICRL
jgi:hypothetical protein